MATLCWGGLVGLPAVLVAERGSDKPIPPAPPLPAIRALRLEPSKLTLLDARDSRKVLVLGGTADGSWIDLGPTAVLKPESPAVAVDAEGYLVARQTGKANVAVTAAGKTARLEVEVKSMTSPEVGFVRDIEPILSRAGATPAPATVRPRARMASSSPCAGMTRTTTTRPWSTT